MVVAIWPDAATLKIFLTNIFYPFMTGGKVTGVICQKWRDNGDKASRSSR
jgi:hypothetical protein